MARHSRDAGPAHRSRGSSPRKRERSATQSGPPREDQEDRENRAFHARIRARQAEAEDRDRETGPPRR